MPALKSTVFLLFAIGAMTVAASVPSRPNILLLMAEDMSSRVGAFGDNVAQTPHIDKLAAQGVSYTQTFTAAGVCAPSRAAHILGMHQISTGTQHMRSSSRPEGGYFSVPPAGVKAYPELLRAAGYYTYTDSKLDYQFSKPMANSGPPTIWDEEGQGAANWRGRATNQPFFGFRNFAVTHESGIFTPLGTMPHSVSHLAMQVLRWWNIEAVEIAKTDPLTVPLPPYFPDTQAVRGDIAQHYDNIAVMDAQVGEILQMLEEDGLAESTIVIWTTDHGDGLPRSKRELYDSGIRVPMVIRWPQAFRPQGVAPGGLDSRLISFVDLAPTILTLAGVAVPDYLQGRSFANADTPARQYIYASRDRIDEVMDRQRAVRDARFKYIRSWYPEQPQSTGVEFRDNLIMVRELRRLYGQGQLDNIQSQWFEPVGEERLFDLDNDPHEVRDLSEDPAYRQVLSRLRAEMQRWLSRVGDWSDQPEVEMIARFQFNGERRVTPTPSATIDNGQLHITPSAAGQSLQYRLQGQPWQLYAGPVKVESQSDIDVQAVRYGWTVSEVLKVEQ